MLVLLALNGVELSYTQKELYEVILDVAAGKQEYEDLLDWVRGHQNQIRSNCEYMNEKEAIVLGRIYCELRKGIFFDRKWLQRGREKSLN